MTVDVRVRRCSLTIRRRDGWSWGADPQPHLDAALADVEAALRSAVAEAGLDPSLDASVAGLVRLEIGSDGTVTAASRIALVERLRALVPEAGGAHAEPDGPADEAAVAAAAAAAPGDVATGNVAGPAIARTLARWSRGGQMARVVRGWPESLVRAWIEAVAAAVREDREAGDVANAAMSAEAVAMVAGAVLDDAAPGETARATAERLLVLLAALTAALGDVLPDAATQAIARAQVAGTATADEIAPRVAMASDAAASETSADAAPPDAAAPDAATSGARAAAPGAAAGDAARDMPAAPSAPPQPASAIVPALPLLVLAQLARIGYVDAIAAAAQAAELRGGAAGLAAALAGKVLPAPARGWAREPAELAVIALASGRPPAWVPEGLAEVASNAGALLPPLAAALQAAYAEARSAHDEVLVTRCDDGILVGEEEGVLPIAWVATEDELDVALEALGRPPVRRADCFAPIARPIAERLALPRMQVPALECHLGAAAGTALGLLTLDLWGAGRGVAPTPLVALQRLGDLDARVQATADGLVVSIPRGQRWLDLRRAGLLEWFRIPWLPGARLEIGTW